MALLLLLLPLFRQPPQVASWRPRPPSGPAAAVVVAAAVQASSWMAWPWVSPKETWRPKPAGLAERAKLPHREGTIPKEKIK